MGKEVESEEEFSPQFAEIDFDKDGKVSYEDMKRFLYATLQMEDLRDSSFIQDNGVDTAQLAPESISAITKLFEENKAHY